MVTPLLLLFVYIHLVATFFFFFSPSSYSMATLRTRSSRGRTSMDCSFPGLSPLYILLMYCARSCKSSRFCSLTTHFTIPVLKKRFLFMLVIAERSIPEECLKKMMPFRNSCFKDIQVAFSSTHKQPQWKFKVFKGKEIRSLKFFHSDRKFYSVHYEFIFQD